MSEENTQEIRGEAKDGTIFTADSPEVKDFMQKYPDVTLEAAIGSVVNQYNSDNSDEPTPEADEAPAEAPAEEEASEDAPAEEEAAEEAEEAEAEAEEASEDEEAPNEEEDKEEK